MKKINRGVLWLMLAAGIALSGAKSVFAAPTHFIVKDRAYKVFELTPSNPNYLNKLLAEIASGAPTYIADDEGKTFNVNEITGDYMEAFAKAPNLAANLGPVREVEGDLTVGNLISLPGAKAEAELKVESVKTITTDGVQVIISKLAEDLVDANVVVKSSTGEVVETNPTTLKAGATEATFRFKYPIGGNPVTKYAPWTVNGVGYEVAPDEVRTYYYEGRSDKLRWGWIDLIGSDYDWSMTITLMDYDLFLEGEPVTTEEMITWLRANNDSNAPVELTGTTLNMRSPAGKEFIKNERESVEVLRLTNIERVKHGITEFELDKKLHEVQD